MDESVERCQPPTERKSLTARKPEPNHSRPDHTPLGKPLHDKKPTDKNSAAAGIKAKSPVKPAKAKADRARDLKNKGAPKWLKEKRETPPSDKV